MEFFPLIEKRSSQRKYIGKAVEKEKIDSILEAANKSPSAGNLQAFEILIVHDGHKRDLLVDAAWGQKFIREAPVCLVFCTNPSRSTPRYEERGEKLYCVQDATIAATFAMLAATDLGLSSCWVGAFQENLVGKILSLPPTIRPIIILPIGYADGLPKKTPRRSLTDLVKEA